MVENNPRFQHIKRNAKKMIEVCTNWKFKKEKKEKEEEESNMCLALREMVEDAKAEGRTEGREEMRQEMCIKEIRLIRKKWMKKYSSEEIADMLELEIGYANTIIGLLDTHLDWDDAQIYEALMNKTTEQ